MASHYLELYPPKEKMLRIVFGTSFRRLNRNQREKLSEVKSPLPRLTKVNNRIQKDLFRHRPNTVVVFVQ